MGRNGGCDFREWERLLDNLKTADAQLSVFIEGCAKEIAARLLAKVVKRTPVGDYRRTVEVVAKRNSKNHRKGDVYTKKVKNASGKVGGTLRRGWTAGQSATNREQYEQYAQSLPILRVGDSYVIELTNNTEYALT